MWSLAFAEESCWGRPAALAVSGDLALRVVKPRTPSGAIYPTISGRGDVSLELGAAIDVRSGVPLSHGGRTGGRGVPANVWSETRTLREAKI
jgi:hypothetical protein